MVASDHHVDDPPIRRRRAEDDETHHGLPISLRTILGRLANRSRPRSEATLQADIRQLLLNGDFGLGDDDLDVDLETQVGDGRRIDIETGFTVIEVKKSLAGAGSARSAERQLAGYLQARSGQTGQRYVGVLTDGMQWRAYHLVGDGLSQVTRHDLTSAHSSGLDLLFWLEGVLATRQGIPPTPAEIARRLGADSTSHALDRAALAALYDEHADAASVKLKRELWAQLLRSALGTQFVDDKELFIEHTLMMNSASIIAHLVVGFDVMSGPPANLLSGQRFDQAGIGGVVEHDFFDWTIEVPGGAPFVLALTRRLARFDWSQVQHDVLKTLYESIIGAETRKRMGEYYTPDWLAERVVDATVTEPLRQRVLDPACGSGTFLFHAVRRYLNAADQAGVPLTEALTGLSDHVVGVDLHPVAVALARVTYLLAIGRDRLNNPSRGPVSIPVYLGDSVQWQERIDLFTEEHLKIRTGVETNAVVEALQFPEHLLNNASQFDRLVTSLSALAAKPHERRTRSALTALLDRLAIDEQDRPLIAETFSVMSDLHDEDRNHIWNYYIRNLARPVWLAMQANRVDVLVGNPPWLSYRHMSAEMQSVFRTLSRDRGLWHGNQFATHQDLSALFVARTIQQYLKVDGSFGFVMPNAALDGDYFSGFRYGWYSDPVEPTAVAFTHSWDLRRLRPHLFPQGAGVVFGRRTTTTRRRALPSTTERWSGKLPPGAQSWQHIEPCVWREDAELAAGGDTLDKSPYEPRFSSGANIFPQVLFFVEDAPAGPLGRPAGFREVRSARSSYEKAPWRSLPGVEGMVEARFVRPVLRGDSLLPYRILRAREAVLPLVGSRLIDIDDPELERHPGLEEWWRRVEDLWTTHRSSVRLTLAEQLDYRHKLTAQIPAPPLRVAYGKAGMHVAAAVVNDPDTIIEHALYFCTVASRAEGNYLCAILNSPVLTELVRPLMSYGKDERDVSKHLWRLPIPLYDPDDPKHQRLADLGSQQARAVEAMDIDVHANFVTLRRQVRAALAAHPGSTEIGAIVQEMLS
ncbi:N-6 DNA methylase [Planosporangium flavigriseum]|uniref:site-specific DNA-methyltransferase (adenine-specific) n=1 Tax=Planosporangium flavigriseum TaxID=373681 RepID=A0A8J3LKT1_9ACTN|nr:N-6 DNA methylase [Planosporangium flavigriseum]NJC62923.1 N-6 DNA methylase [Planosporangium flavigriseum]GIG73214.1 BseRI endonuclease [Planosporangium flavigriseum]